MPRKPPYVRVIALKGLPEFIQSLGGDSVSLFQAVGLDINQIQDDHSYVSWVKFCHLLELCAETLQEPHFGMKWAQALSEDLPNTGPLVFAVSLVKNARECIKILLDYQKVQSNGVICELFEDASSGTGSYVTYFHPQTPACRQYTEHVAAVKLRIVERFMHDVSFLEFHFPHAPLADISFYESKFNARVFFDAPHFKVVGKLTDLDKSAGKPTSLFKFPLPLTFMRPFLKTYLDRKLKRVRNTDQPITSSIAEILPAIFGTGKSDIDSVALAFDFSTKKMQRLLKDEGTTFSAIRDRARRQISARLLKESNIPISAIAAALDYKSTEAFNTACKRWFETSPRDYRADQRAKATTA